MSFLSPLITAAQPPVNQDRGPFYARFLNTDMKPTASAAYKHLYKTSRWTKASKSFRYQNPLCSFCGRLSEVVDHIKPHRGDLELFHDPSNWQSLCKKCHDSKKKQIEQRGYYSGSKDGTGLPSDPNHPFNRV